MKDYDAIVIGSGSGGLAAALALARAGQRVLVLEQHSRPGGYTQSFELNGFRFSPGIHYVGSLGPGGRLREIYEGLGVANDLVFLELNPDAYDHVRVGHERFDIPKGRERYAARLRARFPSEASGIDGYFAEMGRMIDEMFWAAETRDFVDTVLLPLRVRHLLRGGLEPLGRFLDRFTKDPLLRAILTIQAGDHAMAPARAPAALHAGLLGYYLDGACYPRGGAHTIAETFIAHLRRYGGEIRVGAEVDRILIADGAAFGVRLADGSRIRADVVVSNTDPGVTWGHLVAPRYLTRALARRIARMRWSLSTLSLFLGCDMDLRAAGCDSGNVWFSRTPDVDASWRFAERGTLTGHEEIPGLFFNVTTLKDPSMRTDGLHTVEAITLASIDAFARWRETRPGKRPADYAALKGRLTERILDAVECIVPGFRDHVVHCSLATPLTNLQLLHATNGAIYGTEKSLRNLGPFGFTPGTHIRGLFQCGASILAPGLSGVTQSGLAAAAAALGCRVDDLLNASGQAIRIYPSEAPETWPEDVRPRCQRRSRTSA